MTQPRNISEIADQVIKPTASTDLVEVFSLPYSRLNIATIESHINQFYILYHLQVSMELPNSILIVGGGVFGGKYQHSAVLLVGFKQNQSEVLLCPTLPYSSKAVAGLFN